MNVRKEIILLNFKWFIYIFLIALPTMVLTISVPCSLLLCTPIYPLKQNHVLNIKSLVNSYFNLNDSAR